MVDYYGNWTYEKDTPANKMCDLDRVAQMIDASGYKPETTIENLTEMVVVSYDGYLLDEGVERFAIKSDIDDVMINTEDVLCYVDASGGFEVFDYYC